MARYIDADNLKTNILSWLAMDKYYHPYSKGTTIPTGEVFDLLETEPTADVQPVVRGEWIAEEIHNCWTEFECSFCKFKHKSVHNFGKPMTEFNYCPNCGARMVEGGRMHEEKS